MSKNVLNCIFVYDSIVSAVMAATLESLSIQEGAEGVMYDIDFSGTGLSDGPAAGQADALMSYPRFARCLEICFR